MLKKFQKSRNLKKNHSLYWCSNEEIENKMTNNIKMVYNNNPIIGSML